jgi:hypothetical protein
LVIVDELDTQGDPTISEGNQVPKASSPLVSVSHFDQQDENSSLFGDATFGLNKSDGARSS